MTSMAFQSELVNKIKECLRHKFAKYNPETDNMPFHYRLLGKDRMALYSFIQSLNTTFGISIYEPVAKELARNRFLVAEGQVNSKNVISSEAHLKIQEIMDGITAANRAPDSKRELTELREVCQKGNAHSVRLRKYDLFLKSRDGSVYCIELKTVKPNISGFEDHKRMLLSWAAAEMYADPSVNIHPQIGIPYNPYEPQPYNRWTMRGIFDLQNEVKVAEELWNFIGGEGAYKILLDSFEQAGIDLRPEIDEYFRRFRNN